MIGTSHTRSAVFVRLVSGVLLLCSAGSSQVGYLDDVRSASSPGFSFLGPSVTGDFDGDGLEDLVVLGTTAAAPNTPVWLFLGNDGVSFAAPVSSPPSTSVVLGKPVAGDLDGDGNLDILTRTLFGFSVAAGAGNGVFSPLSSVLPGFEDFVTGDLNGDGLLDVVGFEVPVQGIPGWRVYFNGPNGFSLFQTLPDIHVSNRVFLMDVDGDARQDLVRVGTPFAPACAAVLTSVVNLNVSRGLPGGTFGATVGTSFALPLGQTERLAVGDVDADGLGDIVGAAYEACGLLRFYTMLGGGGASGFGAPSVVLSTGTSPTEAMFVADVDADGFDDILVQPAPLFTGPVSTRQICYFLNDRAGALTGPVSRLYPTRVAAPSIMDHDVDGDVDVAFFADGGAAGVVASSALYGSPCAGAVGAPRFTTALPTTVAPLISLGVADALPGAPTLLMTSLAAAPGSPPACSVLIDDQSLLPAPFGLVVSATDPTGAAVLSFVPPQLPVGLELFFQWAVLDPAGSFNVAGFGFSLTRGRKLIF